MKIAETIARHSMFGPGARLGVAVSGGADSVAMLHMLLDLDWRLSITVLHLNHGLRGEASDADAAFVEALAARLGFPCAVERLRLDAEAANLEEIARRARLDFFSRMRGAHGLDRVATAHTMSDQAETVLFRFLRGAGTTGFSAILPVTAEGLVRPLIETSRQQVLAYLAARKIEWREDRSNADARFSRNRIRHGLLPQLAREWNPGLAATLSHTAAVANDERLYWKEQVRAAWQRLTRPHPRGIVLVGSVAAGEPRALLRHVIRAAIEEVKGDIHRIGFEHVETILRMLLSGEPRRTRIPGIEATHWRDSIFLAAPFVPYCSEVTESGIEIPGAGERVRVVLEQCGYNEDAWTDRNALDADRAAGPLVVRNWNQGDAYRPMNYRSVQRVNDLFQSARIPLWDRHNWPIITRGGPIVWTKRFGASAEAGCTKGTRRVLRVVVEKWWDNESKGAVAPSEKIGGSTAAWESA